MAYDEQLADRVRAALPADAIVEERKMFGGLTFMLNGSMCCGVFKDALMARLGAEGRERAVGHPHVRPMELAGRPMTGMVLVDPPGLGDAALQGWVDQAADWALRLAPAPRLDS